MSHTFSEEWQLTNATTSSLVPVADPDGMMAPAGILRGNDGTLFVVDMYACCVRAYAPDGRYLYQFGQYGTGDGHLRAPNGIAETPSGHVLVTDSGNHRVTIWTYTGTFVGWIGRSTCGGVAYYPAGSGKTPMASDYYTNADRDGDLSFYLPRSVAVEGGTTGVDTYTYFAYVVTGLNVIKRLQFTHSNEDDGITDVSYMSRFVFEAMGFNETNPKSAAVRLFDDTIYVLSGIYTSICFYAYDTTYTLLWKTTVNTAVPTGDYQNQVGFFSTITGAVSPVGFTLTHQPELSRNVLYAASLTTPIAFAYTTDAVPDPSTKIMPGTWIAYSDVYGSDDGQFCQVSDVAHDSHDITTTTEAKVVTDLLLDTSGSMAENIVLGDGTQITRIAAATQALKSYILALGPSEHFGMLEFGHGAGWNDTGRLGNSLWFPCDYGESTYPQSMYQDMEDDTLFYPGTTQNKDELSRIIVQANGGTPFYSALKRSSLSLTKFEDSELREGRPVESVVKAIVVITDGAPGDQPTAASAISSVVSSGAYLFIIGIGAYSASEMNSVVDQIRTATGDDNRAHFIPADASVLSLTEVYSEVHRRIVTIAKTLTTESTLFYVDAGLPRLQAIHAHDMEFRWKLGHMSWFNGPRMVAQRATVDQETGDIYVPVYGSHCVYRFRYNNNRRLAVGLLLDNAATLSSMAFSAARTQFAELTDVFDARGVSAVFTTESGGTYIDPLPATENPVYTTTMTDVREALYSVTQTSTTTLRLYDTLLTALTSVNTALIAGEVTMDDARALVAVVGGADTGSTATLDDVRNSALHLGVSIYIVGCGDLDYTNIRTLCEDTGGEFYLALYPQQIPNIIDSAISRALLDRSRMRIPDIIGGFGSGEGQLKWPIDVAIGYDGDQKYLYVLEGDQLDSLTRDAIEINDPSGAYTVQDASTQNGRISVFTANGNFVRTIIPQDGGGGVLSSQHGITADNAGYIYVSDYPYEAVSTGVRRYGRIQKLSANGIHVATYQLPRFSSIGDPDLFPGFAGIGIEYNATGNVVYVSGNGAYNPEVNNPYDARGTYLSYDLDTDPPTEAYNALLDSVWSNVTWRNSTDVAVGDQYLSGETALQRLYFPNGVTALYIINNGMPESWIGLSSDAETGWHPMDGDHLPVGTRDNRPGAFWMPRGVAHKDGGQLFVVDTGNYRMQAFRERRPPFITIIDELTDVTNGVLTLTFFAEDPDGYLANVRVTWGDGVFDEYLTSNVSYDYNSDGVEDPCYQITHTYTPDGGTFTVTAEAIDNEGNVTGDSTVVVIPPRANTLPVCAFTWSLSAHDHRTITINASGSSDPDGFIAVWEFNPGDGTGWHKVDQRLRATDPFNWIASYTYPRHSQPFTPFRLTVRVRDNGGLSASAADDVDALNSAPTCSLQLDSESSIVRKHCALRPLASDSDGVIDRMELDWGDGTPKTSLTRSAIGTWVEHTYANNGNYTARLTVWDDDGASAFADLSFTVLQTIAITVTPPTAAIYPSGYVVFTATLTGNYSSPDAVRWSIINGAPGDRGVFIDRNGVEVDSVTGRLATYKAQGFGVYYVQAEAMDDPQITDVAAVQIVMDPTDPQIEVHLVANITRITPGELVTLSWTSLNADHVESSTFGATAVTGSTTVAPMVTTTYRITVHTEAIGFATDYLTIYVNEPAPPDDTTPTPRSIERTPRDAPYRYTDMPYQIRTR